jgi:hypothetical protein
MNNRTKLSIVFSLLLLTSLACSLTGLLPGGDSGGLRPTNELWADVPKMDGLGASDMELPLVARIFMETMMSAALSGGTGNGDVAVFNTTSTAADIQAFYTNERMTASGWAASEQDTCFTGSEQGVEDVGLFCVFYKEGATTETGLVLIATPGEQAGQTSLFFIRIENAATPSP